MFKKMVLPICIAVVLLVSAIVGGVLIINNVNKYDGDGGGTTNTPSNVNLSGNNNTTTESVHSHKFDLNPVYAVENDKVYVTYECSNGCNERSEKKIVSNAVIVTPATIQDVLDTDINGKMVVLSAGAYEYFELRPTLANVQKISVDMAGGTDFGEPIYVRSGSNFREISELVQDEKSYNYLYETEFKDITIVGVEGAILKNRFDVVSGEVDYMNLLSEDPIRDIDYTEEGWKHTTKLSVKNLKLLNLKFVGVGATVNISYSENDYTHYDGITIQNCSFTAEYEPMPAGSPAVRVDNAKNVNVLDNDIVGHFYGVYTTNIFNFNLTNNTIKQTNKNAIVLQSGISNAYFMGNINIESNRIEDVYGTNSNGDRAIYMKNGKYSTVVIKDNTFVNAKNSSGQVAKVFSLENSLFTFSNNNYFDTLQDEGRAISNIINSGESSFDVKVS